MTVITASSGRISEEVLDRIEQKGIDIPIRHMSNSGGVLNFPEYNLDMVRPGIMTYGIYPGPTTRSEGRTAARDEFQDFHCSPERFPQWLQHRLQPDLYIRTSPRG